MIYESRYWKEDLRKIAARMEKRKQQRRWPDRSYVALEKDIFVGFYAIRKLIEARKLSTSVAEGSVDVTVFPATGKGVTWLNSHRLGELYDLDSPNRERINITTLCNQVVHSYVFMFGINNDGTLRGIYVSSDRMRNTKVFFADVDTLITLIGVVADDDPVKGEYRFNQAKGDFDVKLFSESDEAAEWGDVARAD